MYHDFTISISFHACMRHMCLIHKNLWHSFLNDFLGWNSTFPPVFSNISPRWREIWALWDPIKSGNRLSTEYKRALFRANRRTVLLELYSEPKGPRWSLHIFLSPHPPDSFCRGWISRRSQHPFSYSLLFSSHNNDTVSSVLCVFSSWLISQSNPILLIF